MLTESMHEFYGKQFSAFRLQYDHAKDLASLKKVTQKAQGQIDLLYAEVLSKEKVSVACCAGCSFCCHLKVDVRAEEVFLITDFMRRHMKEDKIKQVLQVANENRQKIQPLTIEQHLALNLPCALLEQGQCMIYPVRPSQCRRFHAQRLQTCEYSYQHPDDLHAPDSQIPELKATLLIADQAHADACASSGYDNRIYDLNSALSEALSNPKTERRWRDKKSAFSHTAVAKEPATNQEPF